MAVVGTIYGLTHNFAGESTSILASNFGTGTGNFSPLFGAVGSASKFDVDDVVIPTFLNRPID